MIYPFYPGRFDFDPINSDNLDVFRTLNQDTRIVCFNVSIAADTICENSETFYLQLSFDRLLETAVSSRVNIEPSMVYVTIEDANGKLIDCVNLLNPLRSVDCINRCLTVSL